LAAIDISESEEVVARAQALNGLGFKAKDAIHIISHAPLTDGELLKKAGLVSELAIMNPVDYDFSHDDE